MVIRGESMDAESHPSIPKSFGASKHHQECARTCDIECMFFQRAWFRHTDVDCRRMETRKCPIICASLDGVCARFEIRDDDTAKVATWNFCSEYLSRIPE